jgi:hypothetical protein
VATNKLGAEAVAAIIMAEAVGVDEIYISRNVHTEPVA